MTSAPTRQPIGRPLQIVRFNDNHTFELDEEVLNRILLHSNVWNRKVVVLSVVGAFRKGKSFLLNLCLRYLQEDGSLDWLDDSTPSSGFHWRGGAKSDTTGIWMWSEPFVVNMNDGEKVAVLLIDTQGAFDGSSTPTCWARVFALSSFVSSVQVYNLMQQIQQDDLQHLQMFSGYGRTAMKRTAMDGNEIKPFQNLYFLIRDWQWHSDYSYGVKDGDKYVLDKVLEVKEGQADEINQPRTHIRECFNKIGCFLMPHPGKEVATDPKFDGRPSALDPEFREHLRALLQLLLGRENLVVKTNHGIAITGRQLARMFKAYMKLLQDDKMPKPRTWYQANVDLCHSVAVEDAWSSYEQKMKQFCYGGAEFNVDDSKFKEQHKRCKEEALSQFEERRKMGDKDTSQKYVEVLERKIDEHFGEEEAKRQAERRKNVEDMIKNVAIGAAGGGVLVAVSGAIGLAAVGLVEIAGPLAITAVPPAAALVVRAVSRRVKNEKKVKDSD